MIVHFPLLGTVTSIKSGGVKLIMQGPNSPPASISCISLVHGRWLSPDTPASSTTKTSRHDIDEILLKVALNTINQINQI
jgi:hypothetical protein